MNDVQKEAVDIYVYRLAELKAVQIGRVSRVLKQIAADCLLNSAQNKLTKENMNQVVKQVLSTGQIIDYKVGDRPFTSVCDYMDKCEYSCIPSKTITDEDVKLDTFSEPFILMNTDKITQRIRSLMKENFFYKKKDLISQINVTKIYPLVQINAALNQLVEDRSEFITDKYGRLGNLINIGELYLFQPLELNNNHISVYNRSVPLEYKRSNLKFTLPNSIEDELMNKVVINKSEEEETVDDDIIKNLRKNYMIATRNNENVKGQDNWYMLYSVTTKKPNLADVSQDILSEILVAHMIEELNFKEKLHLLNYLETKSLDEFETKLKNYFNDKIMNNNGTTGILFANKGKKEIIVKTINNDQVVWKIGESEDLNDLRAIINQNNLKLVPSKKELNNLIGFLDNFKGDYMVFKVKDITKKRHKGARCDQSGKADAIKTINAILGSTQYLSTSSISQKELCVLQELMLRLYNKEQKNGKYWFLTPVEAIMLAEIKKLSDS